MVRTVITYRDGADPQRIYAFTSGPGNTLTINYWNGNTWQRAPQGLPPGTTVRAIDAVTFAEAGKRYIHAFVTGHDGTPQGAVLERRPLALGEPGQAVERTGNPRGR